MSGIFSGRLCVKTDGGVFKNVKNITIAPIKGPVNRAVKKMIIAAQMGAIDKPVF